VAAVGWLAQQALFVRLVQQFGAARVATLDSEALMRDPAAAVGRLAALFGIPLEAGALTEIVGGPAFTRHSKFDGAFAAADREAEHRAAAQIHADEIEKVAVWAEVVGTRRRSAACAARPLLATAA
jgi:hypothetical protein